MGEKGPGISWLRQKSRNSKEKESNRCRERNAPPQGKNKPSNPGGKGKKGAKLIDEEIKKKYIRKRRKGRAHQPFPEGKRAEEIAGEGRFAVRFVGRGESKTTGGRGTYLGGSFSSFFSNYYSEGREGTTTAAGGAEIPLKTRCTAISKRERTAYTLLAVKRTQSVLGDWKMGEERNTKIR